MADPEPLTARITTISKKITDFSNAISKDFSDLGTAKRAKVIKYESTKRKLKLSAEKFHLYLSEVDCLFEYLCDKELEEVITTGSLEVVQSALDQLLCSVTRAKKLYDEFQLICKEAEEKCRKGAAECGAYAVLTNKKRSDRLKGGRNLIINQLLVGAGGLVTLITLITVLANGSIKLDATSASGLVIAVLVCTLPVVAAIVFVILIVVKRKDFNLYVTRFENMEIKFKGLDEQIVNLRQVLISELHSRVLSMETLLLACKELLKDKESNAGSKHLLKINLEIMSRTGQGYREESQELHQSLKEFFSMQYIVTPEDDDKSSSTEPLLQPGVAAAPVPNRAREPPVRHVALNIQEEPPKLKKQPLGKDNYELAELLEHPEHQEV